MGLPQVIINLQTSASTLINRSARGIVVLLLNETKKSDTKSATYTKVTTAIADTANWTPTNILLIRNAFLGNPSKVICYKINDAQTVDNVLEILKGVHFSYMAYPTADDKGAGTAKIVTWVETERADKHWVRAVVYNNAADNEGVINFTTASVTSSLGTFTGYQFTSRIAGVLAGISLARSATYYVLSEVTDCTASTTPDADVEAGKFFLINDGSKVKTSRAVNSLTTTGETKSEEWKKIKIVEAIDLIYEDIRTTFEDSYIGKVPNSYDNRVAFCSAINNYFDVLEREGVLYDGYDNSVEVDVDAQQTYLENKGTDCTDMSEEDIKNANTGSVVYLKGSVQFQDAMEDLTINLVC